MTTQITAQEPKLYIGIDIHNLSRCLAGRNRVPKVSLWEKIHFCTDLFDCSTLTFSHNSEALRLYVEKYYRGHQVFCAYEAGCCGYSAYREFVDYN